MRFLSQLRNQRQQPKQAWLSFQRAAGTDEEQLLYVATSETGLPGANCDENCPAIKTACEIDVDLLRQENRILGSLSDVQLLSSGIVGGSEPAEWWQPGTQMPDVPLDLEEHLQMCLAAAEGITASAAAGPEVAGRCAAHSPTESLKLLLLRARNSEAAVQRPGSVAAAGDGASGMSDENARVLRFVRQVENGTGNPAAAEGSCSRVASNDASATSKDIQRLLRIARQIENENSTGSAAQQSSSRVLSADGASDASKDVQKPHGGGRQVDDSRGSNAVGSASASLASANPQPTPPLPQLTLLQANAAPSSLQAHADWLDEDLLLAEATLWSEPEALGQLPFPEVGGLQLHSPARWANNSRTGSSASGSFAAPELVTPGQICRFVPFIETCD